MATILLWPGMETGGAPRNPTFEDVWRRRAEFEVSLAHQVRRMLAREAMYPRSELARRPEAESMIENQRAALCVIAQELDANDLCAVFTLARLLVLTPRGIDR